MRPARGHPIDEHLGRAGGDPVRTAVECLVPAQPLPRVGERIEGEPAVGGEREGDEPIAIAGCGVPALDERREPLVQPGRHRRVTRQLVKEDMCQLVPQDRERPGTEDVLGVDHDRIEAGHEQAAGLRRQPRGEAGWVAEMALEGGGEAAPVGEDEHRRHTAELTAEVRPDRGHVGLERRAQLFHVRRRHAVLDPEIGRSGADTAHAVSDPLPEEREGGIALDRGRPRSPGQRQAERRCLVGRQLRAGPLPHRRQRRRISRAASVIPGGERDAERRERSAPVARADLIHRDRALVGCRMQRPDVRAKAQGQPGGGSARLICRRRPVRGRIASCGPDEQESAN